MKGANAVMAAFLIFAGCQSAGSQAQEGASRVRVGMSEEEVRRAVGSPSMTEPAGGDREFWTYHYSNDRFRDLGAPGEHAGFVVVFDRETRRVIRVARK